jgi:hypothetical protein
MGDQGKIIVLKKQILDLERKRSELIERRSHQTGRLLTEINRALESRGWFTVSSSPILLPEEYDPDGELRRLEDQITKLNKAVKSEEEKL